MHRLIILLVLAASSSAAQTSAGPDKTVHDYIALYNAKSIAKWKQLFHPQLTVASPAEDGSIRVRNLEQFYGAQERGFKDDPTMHEVLENVRIHSGRRIARVTADFIFTSAGKSDRGKLGLHLVEG